MFRTKPTATESHTEELELTLETLKDLTVTGRVADGVQGGVTSRGYQCECGTV